MSSSRAPVIVFAYNRPSHLKETLVALSKAECASESELWLFCDGPKSELDGAAVEAVRLVALDAEWDQHFAKVTRVIAESNRGLAKSVIGGVSRVLDESDRVIVLEDDLIVAPDFLRFMNDCLVYYRDEQKAGSVTGFCPLSAPPPNYKHDVMAVPRNCSCGWGIWADRWKLVDWEASAAEIIWQDSAIRRRFNAAGSDRVDRLRRQLAGQIDSWSIRFGLWQLLEGRHTIYPTVNRIRNIGYDGTGVHSGTGTSKNDHIDSGSVPYRLEHVVEDPDVLRAFRRTYSGSLLGRFVRFMRSEVIGVSR